MTTQQQRDYYEDLTKKIIKEAAGKNKFAYDYLWKLMCISRTVDDIYDLDQDVSRGQLLEAISYLLVEMPYNPFFSKHREALSSQHVTMYNAWLAANLWDKSKKEIDKIYAHVWRDYHQEVVPLVALLTQGPKKMQEVSFNIRQMFKKNLGE